MKKLFLFVFVVLVLVAIFFPEHITTALIIFAGIAVLIFLLNYPAIFILALVILLAYGGYQLYNWLTMM